MLNQTKLEKEMKSRMWDYSRFDNIDSESSDDEKEQMNDQIDQMFNKHLNQEDEETESEEESENSYGVDEENDDLGRDIDLHVREMVAERVKREIAEEEANKEVLEHEYGKDIPINIFNFLHNYLLEFCTKRDSTTLTRDDLCEFTWKAYPNKNAPEIHQMVQDLCYINDWGDFVEIQQVLENYTIGWMEAPAAVMSEVINMGYDPEKYDDTNFTLDYQNILDNWLFVMTEKEQFLEFAMNRVKIDLESIADFCHPRWFDFSGDDFSKLTEQNFVSSLQTVDSGVKGVCLFSARHVDFTLSAHLLNNLQVLSLRDTATDDKLRLLMVDCCEKLIALELIGEAVSPDVLLAFLKRCPELLYLRFDMDEMELTPDMIKCILKLERLDCARITNSIILTLAEQCPKLHHFNSLHYSVQDVSESSMKALIEARPDIYFDNFDDAILRKVGHPAGFVNIFAAEMPSEELIQLLDEHSESIKGIILGGYENLGKLPTTLLRLQCFPPNDQISQSPISLEQFEFLSKLTELESLSIPGALPKWGGLFDGELEILNDALVQACCSMPNLKELDLSHTGVTLDALQVIVANAKKLQHLTLSECTGEHNDSPAFICGVQEIVEGKDIDWKVDSQEYEDIIDEIAQEKLRRLGMKFGGEQEDQEEEVEVLDPIMWSETGAKNADVQNDI